MTAPRDPTGDTMTTSELPGRLFAALVSEIRAHWPDYLHSRFTVAEIYQNVIPWRTHRHAMDIATSGEYDQALLRLLAGEGDYLALESQAARDEIQAELKGRFPNTGIYRDFAAVGVRLNPSRLPAPTNGDVERGTATPPEAMDPAGPVEAERDAGAADRARPRDAVGAGRVCSGCDRELPAIEGVRFCPFCGQDARIVACPACGLRIEAEWSYCVGCGRRVQRA